MISGSVPSPTARSAWPRCPTSALTWGAVWGAPPGGLECRETVFSQQNLGTALPEHHQALGRGTNVQLRIKPGAPTRVHRKGNRPLGCPLDPNKEEPKVQVEF